MYNPTDFQIKQVQKGFCLHRKGEGLEAAEFFGGYVVAGYLFARDGNGADLEENEWEVVRAAEIA